MKVIFTSLVALSLVAGLWGRADAARHQKKRFHTSHHSQPDRARTYGYRGSAASDNSNGYYEHVLDKVPFGSQRWWSIYFEQHGTPR
jgi:hypothetical protein